MRKRTIITSAGAAVLAVLLVSALATKQAPAKEAAGFRRPLTFEPNLGQTDAKVSFLTRGGPALWIMGDSATLGLPGQKGAIRMKWAGGNTRATAKGVDQMESTSNYLIGDQSKWRTGVPNYSRVRLHEVYPGIDLLFHPSTDRNLEYDFEVAPGADPTRIAVEFEGSTGLHLEATGDLRIDTAAGAVLQRKPVAYQGEGGSRRDVTAEYEVQGSQVRIALGKYDRSQPLVIDPTIDYLTYYGGSGYEYMKDMAVSSDGNTYIAGHTNSADLPIAGDPYRASLGPNYDGFVARFDPNGGLVFSTYVGGQGFDSISNIALETSGNLALVGEASGINFPPPAPYCAPQQPGEVDFRAVLSASGSSLLYSCAIPPAEIESRDVAVGPDGVKYWLRDRCIDKGQTVAVELYCFGPQYLVRAIAADPAGGVWVTGRKNTSGGNRAFAAKVNSGGGLAYESATCCGEADSTGYDVAVSHTGVAHITGWILTTGTAASHYDALLARFSTASPAPLSAQPIGGSGNDYGNRIALRKELMFAFPTPTYFTRVYISGHSWSANFPVANPIPNTACTSTLRDFVWKSSAQFPPGPGWSTCLPTASDSPVSIGLGSHNGLLRVHTAGSTHVSSLPVTPNAAQPIFAGGDRDGWLMILRQ